MSARSAEDLLRHIGHKIVIATYGDPVMNVAIECEDCCEMLMDYDMQPYALLLSANLRREEREMMEREEQKQKQEGVGGDNPLPSPVA